MSLTPLSCNKRLQIIPVLILINIFCFYTYDIQYLLITSMVMSGAGFRAIVLLLFMICMNILVW